MEHIFKERRAIFERTLENMEYNRRVNSRRPRFYYYMTTRILLLIERCRDLLTAKEWSEYIEKVQQVKKHHMTDGCEFDVESSSKLRYGVALRSFEMMWTIDRMLRPPLGSGGGGYVLK